MAVVAAAELSKLVTTAVEACKAAEGGDTAEKGRALDVLKLLQKKTVTAELLKDTEAGKKINKLAKGAEGDLATAAAAVVQAWKDCVKSQQQPALASQPSQDAKTSSTPPPSTAAAVAAPKQQQASGPTPAAAGVTRQPSNASNSSGGGAIAPPRSHKPPPPTGNSKRDRIRVLFLGGLVMVPEDEAEGDAGAVAAAVETAVFNQYPDLGPDYAAKVRSLGFNLKDANNPDLRRNVLLGVITPEQLVVLPPEELASQQRRDKNKEIREHAAWEATRGNQQVASTDAFQCGKCKQRKCTYYQLQTRSADEPMTTFVQCVNCGNRWKFC